MESTANELWNAIALAPGAPFDKIAVVVSDPATEKWLKQYFLLERKVPSVLMNLDFLPLSEFLNDWLAASVHGIAPHRRRAALHPYSPGVLTWRIYRILSQSDPEDELQELLHYVGQEEPQLRRYALAVKLAKLFDDYQNSRCQMLRSWEKGVVKAETELPLWQPALYRKLAAEDPETYAKDYETAFCKSLASPPPEFRRYRAIHLFDVPFMHEPMLRLLEKISETLPVHVWSFNPQNEWMADSPSIREAVREFRKTAESGQLAAETPELFDVNSFYASPEERLLGIFASGARAMLWNLCSDTNAEISGSRDALAELKQREISIHNTYSPRRELEAVRDGLCDFFRRHPEAKAKDALILCADWESYAPIIETVFGSGKGSVPVTVAGGIAGESPFVQAFHDLLAFRNNRFEAGAVFGLLGVPEIRRKYALETEEVEIVRDMVKKANIHWGIDDADVQRELETEQQGGVFPFVWKRGLARLIAEMLYGIPEDDAALLDVGTFSRLHPCGHVEGNRARTLSALWRFVGDLTALRQKLSPGEEQPVDELEAHLTWILDTFFESGDRPLKALIAARQAVRKVAEAMRIAKLTSVSTDVFAEAVEAALNDFIPGMHSGENAVLFAPLNTFTATPHAFIWVCGLNDGKFPKIEHRPSYDLIGKHPTPFDVSSREKDAFALLKAVLCSRSLLAFSYVGKDVRTNEDIPSSVLLNDLKDYFDAVHIPVKTYHHPMHPYSARCFFRDDAAPQPLPPSYSHRDQLIAQTLRTPPDIAGVVPFPLSRDGVTEIRIEDLAAFCAAPHRFLLESRGARVPECRYDRLYNRESLSARLSYAMKREVALTGGCDPRAAAMMVETGRAPDETSAAAAIEDEENQQNYQRLLTFAKTNAQFNVLKEDGTPESFAGAYERVKREAGDDADAHCPLLVDDCSVQLTIPEPHPVELETVEGKRKFLIFYDDGAASVSNRNRIWLYHLGANSLVPGIASFLFSFQKTGLLFKPLTAAAASEKLTQILTLTNTALPPEFPSLTKVGGDDLLPETWQQELWTKEDFITTRQGRKQGK